MSDLHRVFRTIVMGLRLESLRCATRFSIVIGLSSCSETSELRDAGLDADATTDAVSVADAPADAPADSADASIDSYVAWCGAGAPEHLGGDTCYQYFYVPCGLPADEVADDAGVLSRCDQLCVGFVDDLCAVLPPPWPATIIDAGLIDASSLTDGGLFVLCACVNGGGRKPAGLASPTISASSPLGAYFAHMAFLEAASIPAFVRMHAELRTLGAPEPLLADVRRAARDEKRHETMAARLAHRFGGATSAPRVRRFRARSLEAMARENAVEGCAREMFGALIATWQAHHAEDQDVRRAMATIANDETEHAELSLRAAKFFDERLDAPARSRVRRARRETLASMGRAYRSVHPDLVRLAGVPAPSVARRLLHSLLRSSRS